MVCNARCHDSQDQSNGNVLVRGMRVRQHRAPGVLPESKASAFCSPRGRLIRSLRAVTIRRHRHPHQPQTRRSLAAYPARSQLTSTRWSSSSIRFLRSLPSLCPALSPSFATPPIPRNIFRFPSRLQLFQPPIICASVCLLLYISASPFFR
jgi:hypothetical protein